MEKELIRVKTELDKVLKWTTSLQILPTFFSQESSSNRGLGYNSQEDGPSSSIRHARSKNDDSCIHYGKDGHSKDIFLFKTTSSRKRRKQRLLNRIRKKLIFPLSPYWKPRLKWVTKDNKWLMMQGKEIGRNLHKDDNNSFPKHLIEKPEDHFLLKGL